MRSDFGAREIPATLERGGARDARTTAAAPREQHTAMTRNAHLLGTLLDRGH
jgi:hypothetical protein